jgi:glucose-1-phosphate adenylyltransferase
MSETIHSLPAKVVGGRVEDSLVGVGSVIVDATLRRSIIGHGVHIKEGAEVQESIIMDHTMIGKGAKLRRVIIDRYNTVESGHTIGYDRERDERLGYHVDPSGLVALARGVTRLS